MERQNWCSRQPVAGQRRCSDRRRLRRQRRRHQGAHQTRRMSGVAMRARSRARESRRDRDTDTKAAALCPRSCVEPRPRDIHSGRRMASGSGALTRADGSVRAPMLSEATSRMQSTRAVSRAELSCISCLGFFSPLEHARVAVDLAALCFVIQLTCALLSSFPSVDDG